jgi:hypothetical protein
LIFTEVVNFYYHLCNSFQYFQDVVDIVGILAPHFAVRFFIIKEDTTTDCGFIDAVPHDVDFVPLDGGKVTMKPFQFGGGYGFVKLCG